LAANKSLSCAPAVNLRILSDSQATVCSTGKLNMGEKSRSDKGAHFKGRKTNLGHGENK
jgi:hypothetical protein